MALAVLVEQLKKIGSRLNRWLAELRLTIGLSAVLLLLFVLAMIDFMTRYGRSARFTAWGVLVALCTALTFIVLKTLARRRSPEAVAVRVESCFPELDNHLINFLQFSREAVKDAFTAAYVRMDIPHWDGLDFSQMKDRRNLRRAQLALGVATLLLLAPLPFIGQAWSVAMQRILNPFAELAPVSLTSILEVRPGDAVVLQGGNLQLACTVQGYTGHEVLLDIHAADGEEKSYRLGSLRSAEEQVFTHDMFKLTMPFKYRFRAGDAYVEGWHAITLRPPLAFDALQLTVEPPPYMRLPSGSYDAHSESINIPSGSKVTVSSSCNTALHSLILSGLGSPIELALDGGGRGGIATLLVTNGLSMTLSAVAASGEKAETTLGFNLIPDRPPQLSVKAPQRPVALPPGSAPVIDFTVSDDFGFSAVTVEQLPAADGDKAEAKVLKSYSGPEIASKQVNLLWTGEKRRLSDSGTLRLRVVAHDNRAEDAHTTVSPTLIYELDQSSALAKEQRESAKKNLEGLNRVIALQRETIVQTRQLQQSLTDSTAEQWNTLAGEQETIRKIVRLLVEKGGARVFGNLVASVKKLYVKEMFEVIPALKRVPTLHGKSEQEGQVRRAVAMQEKILRQLTFAGEAAKTTQTSQNSGELVGMLDGIITGQSTIITTTARCATQKVEVAESLIDDQDMLSSEIIAFARACRSQASASQGEDKSQSAFLESVAAYCEQAGINDDMLLAAESMEENTLDKALGYQRGALTKLQNARRKFEEVQTQAEKETREEMIDALQLAGAKLDKLRSVEKRLREEMDKIVENPDKNTEDFDIIEDQAAEIEKTIEDALLQIPRDLEIFAHLNVGNDIVEDVYSIFEEVEQEAESGEKSDADEPVNEKAVIKREYLDEVMERADELFDTYEMWLGDDPDSTKVTVEAMDQEEMPEGVALTPLQTSMEDIIGDLQEIDEELDQEADDGAINAAVPDDAAIGAEITEGDTTTFSAKGKSGNETPDHKEQDGRSNVGRQGMSSGESAAGSGTISEGDDDIEARRTQDPTQSGQVTAEGEADTKATGGGKLGSGKGDDWGDTGGTDRMDASEAGSWAQALENMSRKTEQAYAQASLKGLRTDSLEAAAHHIRQAADAVARNAPIQQIAELRRKALGMLKKAKVELGEGSVANLDGESFTSTLSDVIEADKEVSPEKYRSLNAEYYKKLNEVM